MKSELEKYGVLLQSDDRAMVFGEFGTEDDAYEYYASFLKKHFEDTDVTIVPLWMASRLVVDPDDPPFYVKNKDGNLYGMDPSHTSKEPSLKVVGDNSD